MQEVVGVPAGAADESLVCRYKKEEVWVGGRI